MINLLPFVISTWFLILHKDFVFDFPSPVAAAGDEWINDDQQSELFERSEFSHCRRSSFRLRFPA
jgi:hypothetical protein